MRGTYIKFWGEYSQRPEVLYCCRKRDLHQILGRIFVAPWGIVLLSWERLTSNSGENIRITLRYCTVVVRGTYIKFWGEYSQRPKVLYCCRERERLTSNSGENIRSALRYCTVVVRERDLHQILGRIFAAPLDIVLLSSPKLCTICQCIVICMLSWERLTSNSGENIRSALRYCTVVVSQTVYHLPMYCHMHVVVWATYIKFWGEYSPRPEILYCCRERDLHPILGRIFAAPWGIVLLSWEGLTSNPGENIRSALRYCSMSWELLTSNSWENIRSALRYCTVVVRETYIKFWGEYSQRPKVLYCGRERERLTSNSGENIRSALRYCTVVVRERKRLTSNSGENIRSALRYCTVVVRET